MIVNAALRCVNQQLLALNNRQISCFQKLSSISTTAKNKDEKSTHLLPVINVSLGVPRATTSYSSSYASWRDFSVSGPNQEKFADMFSGKPRPRSEKKGANPRVDRKNNATKLAIVGLGFICLKYIFINPETPLGWYAHLVFNALGAVCILAGIALGMI